MNINSSEKKDTVTIDGEIVDSSTASVAAVDPAILVTLIPMQYVRVLSISFSSWVTFCHMTVYKLEN